MTALHLHPYRPEMGETRALRKVARNYRAQYMQYQSRTQLIKDTESGIWIAVESTAPSALSVRDVDWHDHMTRGHARTGGLHLVLGSSNHHLPPDVLDVMDYHVTIPQFDDVPFLAPATAAAITLHEIFMQTANRTGVVK